MALVRPARTNMLYAPTVNPDLWVGAVATLAGALLGGAISYVLSRLQIKEARSQRLDTARHEDAQRSLDRRFDAYANLVSHVRAYRNAVRPYRLGAGPGTPAVEIDELARSADSASSLVFLVSESPATENACRTVISTIGDTVEVFHQFGNDAGQIPWEDLSERMSHALREFQDAARMELKVAMLDRSTSAP